MGIPQVLKDRSVRGVWPAAIKIIVGISQGPPEAGVEAIAVGQLTQNVEASSTAVKMHQQLTMA